MAKATDKILTLFVMVITLAICIWASCIIIRNPYTYQTRFWLFFMLGMLACVVMNMIDSLVKVSFMVKARYVILLTALLLNMVVVVSMYTGRLNVPPGLVATIILSSGFVTIFIISMLLKLIQDAIKSKSTPKRSSSPPARLPALVISGTGTPSPIRRPGVAGVNRRADEYDDDDDDDYYEDDGDDEYYGEDDTY